MTAIAVAVSLSAGALSSFWLTARYKDARWQAVLAERESTAAARFAEATAQTIAAERASRELADKLEEEHAKYQDQHDRLLAENRRLARELGGMRDPGARACSGAVSQATASGQPQDAAACGRLSDEATEFLLAFARDADRAAAYAKTCHEWVMGQ